MKTKFGFVMISLVSAIFSSFAFAEGNSLASIDIGKIVMESCKETPGACKYYKELHAGLTGRVQTDENVEQDFIDETKKIEKMLNAQVSGTIKSEDMIVAQCSKMDDSSGSVVVVYDSNCLTKNYKEVNEICKDKSLSKEIGLFEYCNRANL